LIKTVSVELDHIREFEGKSLRTTKTVTVKDLPIIKLRQSSTSINMVLKKEMDRPTFTSQLNKGYNSYLPNNIIIEESPSMRLDNSKIEESRRNTFNDTRGNLIRTSGDNGDSFIEPVTNNTMTNNNTTLIGGTITNHTLAKSNYRSETEMISPDISPIDTHTPKNYYAINSSKKLVAVATYENDFFLKRYFIFQLRKTFLAIKKHTFNKKIIRYKTLDDTTALHNLSNIPGYNRKDKLIYQDIFTNYTQITHYEKGENNTLRINNYKIFKNEIIGKGSFSEGVFKAKNCADGKEYVRRSFFYD
jgi:hypothetical protein